SPMRSWRTITGRMSAAAANSMRWLTGKPARISTPSRLRISAMAAPTFMGGSWGWAGQVQPCYTQSADGGEGWAVVHGVLHAEADMLTFYFAPGSSSMAPHISLHEVGVPFEPRPMSFKNGDLRRPEYVALNPEGKVPTLVVDGRPLTEVAAI